MFNDMVHFIREAVRRLCQAMERVPERRQAVSLEKTQAGLQGAGTTARPKRGPHQQIPAGSRGPEPALPLRQRQEVQALLRRGQVAGPAPRVFPLAFHGRPYQDPNMKQKRCEEDD